MPFKEDLYSQSRDFRTIPILKRQTKWLLAQELRDVSSGQPVCWGSDNKGPHVRPGSGLRGCTSTDSLGFHNRLLLSRPFNR